MQPVGKHLEFWGPPRASQQGRPELREEGQVLRTLPCPWASVGEPPRWAGVVGLDTLGEENTRLEHHQPHQPKTEPKQEREEAFKREVSGGGKEWLGVRGHPPGSPQ